MIVQGIEIPDDVAKGVLDFVTASDNGFSTWEAVWHCNNLLRSHNMAAWSSKYVVGRVLQGMRKAGIIIYHSKTGRWLPAGGTK